MSASQTFCRSRPPLKKYRPCTVFMRSSITIAPQLHAAKAERVGGLGEEKRWRFSYTNSPEAREIKHTLKYDRLKLPSAFFTDNYGQVLLRSAALAKTSSTMPVIFLRTFHDRCRRFGSHSFERFFFLPPVLENSLIVR